MPPKLIEVEARLNLPRLRCGRRAVVDAEDEAVRRHLRAGHIVKTGVPAPPRRPPDRT